MMQVYQVVYNGAVLFQSAHFERALMFLNGASGSTLTVQFVVYDLEKIAA